MTAKTSPATSPTTKAPAKAPRSRKPASTNASGLSYPSPILGIMAGMPSRVVEETLSHHTRELTAARDENIRKSNNEAAAKVAPLAAEEKATIADAKKVCLSRTHNAIDAYNRAVREAESVLDKAKHAAATARDAAINDASAKFNEGSDVISRALKQTRFMLEEDTRTATAEAQTEFEKYHAEAKANEAARAKVQAAEKEKREKAAAEAIAKRVTDSGAGGILIEGGANEPGKTAAIEAAAKIVKSKGGRVLKADRDGKITDVTESV